MIVFDLQCGAKHVFEAWFGSTADFDKQVARGLIACPICSDASIGKAAMAPAVGAKGNRRSDTGTPRRSPPDLPSSPAEIKAALTALAGIQAKIEQNCDYVGARFAEEARAIHFGETKPRGIFGEASAADVTSLAEDGIAVASLPFRSRRLRGDA